MKYGKTHAENELIKSNFVLPDRIKKLEKRIKKLENIVRKSRVQKEGS